MHTASYNRKQQQQQLQQQRQNSSYFDVDAGLISTAWT